MPGERGEKKETQPLRYVGLRLLKPQGSRFADGSDRHHHAILTNLGWAAEVGPNILMVLAGDVGCTAPRVWGE